LTVPLERTSHPAVPHTRDGWLQAITIPDATQKPRPRRARLLPPHFLVQPATPQHSGYPRLPSRGQLGLHSPLCGPQHRGRTPASLRYRYSTPEDTALLQGIEDPSRKVASLTTEQNRCYSVKT
jgi:hypothetical protein